MFRLGKTRAAYSVGTRRLRDAMVVILLLRLVVTDRQESALVLLSPGFRSYFMKGQEGFARDAVKVAALPGDVFCSAKLVCRAAGKSFVVDEFKLEQMIKTGRATSAEMIDELQRRSITQYVNDPAAVVGLPTSSPIGSPVLLIEPTPSSHRHCIVSLAPGAFSNLPGSKSRSTLPTILLSSETTIIRTPKRASVLSALTWMGLAAGLALAGNTT
jgi:hypothetical protein